MSQFITRLRQLELRTLIGVIVAAIAVLLLVVVAIFALRYARNSPSDPKLKLTRCDTANTTLDSLTVACLPHDGAKEHEGVCLLAPNLERQLQIDAQFTANAPFDALQASLEWDKFGLHDNACSWHLKCPSAAGQRQQLVWFPKYPTISSELVTMTFSLRPDVKMAAKEGVLCVQFVAKAVQKARRELAA